MHIHPFESEISGAALKSTLGKTIYGWFRGEQALYIGSSKRGLMRLFTHPVINVAEPLQDTDSIKVHYFHGTLEAMHEFEKALIIQFQPKYNSTHVNGQTKWVECRNCKKPFEQKRSWQVCCSQRCRLHVPPLERALARLPLDISTIKFHISKKDREFLF